MVKLSIVTVNWWGADWLDLLLRSIKKTVKGPVEIIVVDNSGELDKVKLSKDGVKVVKKEGLIRHGEGLDFGIKEASGEYIFAVDIDAHFLLPNWNELIIDFFNDKKLRILACKGKHLKPIRPCGIFFRRDWFVTNMMSFEARQFDGVKFDVGMHFYFKTLTLTADKGVDFFLYQQSQYEGVNGSEYTFRDQRFLYHNYYGCRWYDIAGAKCRAGFLNLTWDEFIKNKEQLFKVVNL